MKKSIICLTLAVAFLASCDPIKEEKDLTLYSTSASEIESAFSMNQVDVNGNPAADGNYFTYTTSPAMMVSVYNLAADGSENLLSYGYSGKFTIAPKRGSDPNQTFWVRVVNTDGSVTLVEKHVNVFVKQELDPEIRYLASDEYGSKIWKWDASIGNGAVWGNMGYCGGKGSDVGISGNGAWWGVTPDEDGEVTAAFMEQLQHTPDGQAHGDESMSAYMVIDEDGNIVCYDKDNNVIRKGPYTVENFNNSDPDAWKVGDLVTASILWPYEINSGGRTPSKFEIVYLTPDKMTLVYPDNGDFGALGNWGEATYWHFCSNSDIAGMAVGYGKDASKSWTWDYDGEHTVWGNMGYCGDAGSKVGIDHNGEWWGVKNEADFMEQLGHTNDGAAHGDESMDAYFTLDGMGNITRVAGNGTVINKGTYEFDTTVANEWKMANFNTTAGTILFPYEINSGGNMPTTFEVVYLTGSKMCLVYPDKGDFGSLGNWGEATYWHFKAK